MQAYADAQTALYLAKAKKADTEFVGVQEGQQGPVEARLRGYGPVSGLVFGAFGEASEAVHEFVQVVAKSRASGGPGRVGGPKGEVAKLVGQVRRQLGVAAVKVQARLLLERLQLVGQRAPAQQAQVAAAAAEWSWRLQIGLRGRGCEGFTGVGSRWWVWVLRRPRSASGMCNRLVRGRASSARPARLSNKHQPR